MILVGRGADTLKALDLHNMLAIMLQESLCCQLSAIYMVAVDNRYAIVEIPVKGNDRIVQLLIDAHLQGMGTHNKSVHGMPLQHLDEPSLGIFLILGAAKHHLIVQGRQGCFQMLRQLPEEWMGHCWHNQPDDVCPVQGQVAGHLARHIMKPVHGRLDPTAGFLCYIALLIQHQGHGAGSYPCLPCHVFHCYSHITNTLPFPARICAAPALHSR